MSEVSDDVIRIGRGADCHVHLPDPRVPLVHSEIHTQDGASYISILQTLSDLAVNGKATRSARLSIGDRLDIGPYELAVTDCPENTVLCLTVELTRPFGDDFVGLNQRSVTELTSLGFGKTTWSILATVATLVVCLGLPLAAALMPAQQAPDTGAAAAEPRLALQLAAWISGADSLWISGGISNAHRYFADNCSSCHQEPFVQVKDAACLQCHDGIEQHADANEFASASFKSFSCQSCHKEHNGIEPIVLDEQRFCSSCHVRLRTMEPETQVLDVGDFGVAHPEFRPTVMTDPTVPTKVRISLTDAAKLKEMSNLKFPHDKHLRRLSDSDGKEPGGVRHPQKGRIELSCRD
ncbi:MAG: FHA domain-containing protein [Alphaproteobacteria bacterium]|nr:FHA domain-containing protein [Alphaproteobacteria bacterium]